MVGERPADARERHLQTLRSALSAAAATSGGETEMLHAVASWVGALFAGHYTPAGGLPCFEVDGQSGAPLAGKDLLPELDDYLPLLAACGQRDYAVEQAAVVRRALADGRLVVNPDPGLLPWLRRSNPFYYTDLILGMLSCHRLELGEWWLEEARVQADTVLSRFSSNGLLVKEIHLASGLKLPLSESNSLGMVEILVELGELTDAPAYLEAAERLVMPWLEVAEAEAAVPQLLLLNPLMGLLPRFARRRHIALLYKHNLMFLNALWSLARATAMAHWKDAATRLAERVCETFTGHDGLLHYRLRRHRGQPRLQLPTLKCTLLAEHLCDLAVALQQPHGLDRATRLVAPWLELRHPATGLIPYDLQGRASDVDALTDFAVTLLKLHAATANAEYLGAARQLMASMVVHHSGPYGLYRSVDVATGQVLDHGVETRYVSLFLKPWLLLPHAGELYARRDLLSLARDR